VTPFLLSSRNFVRELTVLYDFVNPTAAALWNLRWQVRGYVAESGSTNSDELRGRFLAGSGIGSANLSRHCLERSWEDQMNELSLFALVGAISLYEGWLADLEVGSEADRRHLQFPSLTLTGKSGAGAVDVIAKFKQSPSAALEPAFGQRLRSNRRYFGPRIDDMLSAYRCFKEVRNCYMHAGRSASQLAEDCYRVASQRVSGLGYRGSTLKLPVVEAGKPVYMTLAHAHAVCALLLNMVVTLDAEIALSELAEKAFIERWRANIHRRQLPGNLVKRDSRLKYLCTRMGIPRPLTTNELYVLLKDASLVV
jgi:hypothetical protein